MALGWRPGRLHSQGKSAVHTWKGRAGRLLQIIGSAPLFYLWGSDLSCSKQWFRRKTSLQLGLLTGGAGPFPYATSLDLE